MTGKKHETKSLHCLEAEYEKNYLENNEGAWMTII